MNINKEAIKQVLLERDDAWQVSALLDTDNLKITSQYSISYMAEMVCMVCRPFTEKLDFKEVEYPASWWQHFKRDVFPKKLLDMFPCKNAKVIVDIKAAYPLISLPDEQVFVYATEKHTFPTRYDDEA